MSYTKANPQPSGIPADSVAVTLDDGHNVLLSLTSTAQSNGAPSVLIATAVAADEGWTPEVDAAGSTVQSIFTNVPTAADANDPVKLSALQHALLMVVLGEPPEAPFDDPIHANAVANASIRNKIAALAAAGPIDAAALL